ncbi:biphenyl 2,3-dioxygenase, partial [Streptomyces sp. SID11233]|nr:biphenyl 2,3-dioxygenase [Streptomyces sp. SID11233]
FDPEKLLADRRAGASTEELSDRSWALAQELPDPMGQLMHGGN